MLAGITLITNGVYLGYPFVPCIKNLSKCCDRVFVNTCIYSNIDDTIRILSDLRDELGNITIVCDKWDWSINNGTDLAKKANNCISEAFSGGFKSVLYVQADEVVSHQEINILKMYPQFYKSNFFLERLYFWKDLNSINRSWTMSLPRICKLTENLKVIGDGMSMEVDPVGKSVYVPSDMASIYHYSRVGDTKKIAQRLNNLDMLFHCPETFHFLSDYQFGINNNFETGADTSVIEKVNLRHPDWIDSFYA